MILDAVRTASPPLVVTAVGVRAKRESLGLSRPELAVLSGVPIDKLWEFEGGLVSPEHEHRIALMRALDADFGDLFTVQIVNWRK